MLCSMGSTEDAASGRAARPDGSAGRFVKPSLCGCLPELTPGGLDGPDEPQCCGAQEPGAEPERRERAGGCPRNGDRPKRRVVADARPRQQRNADSCCNELENKRDSIAAGNNPAPLQTGLDECGAVGGIGRGRFDEGGVAELVRFLGVLAEDEHVLVIEQFAHDKVTGLGRRGGNRYVRAPVQEPRPGLCPTDLPHLERDLSPVPEAGKETWQQEGCGVLGDRKPHRLTRPGPAGSDVRCGDAGLGEHRLRVVEGDPAYRREASTVVAGQSFDQTVSDHPLEGGDLLADSAVRGAKDASGSVNGSFGRDCL
jgi:hypothetical protein